MKIALILARYLYSTKKLELPGIGIFYMDPSVIIEPDIDKNSKAEPVSGIRFEYHPQLKESIELTDYIAAKTGKIKALAAADLDSHLGLGLQFLNIGKPFVLEGIGQLIKTQAGQLEFSAGLLQPAVLKDQENWQPMADHSAQSGENDYKDLLNTRRDSVQWKKPAAIFLIVAGLGVAIWGGYTIYKNNTGTDTSVLAKESAGALSKPAASQSPVPQPATSTPASDTSTTSTIPAYPNTTPPVSGMYKFVIETAGRQRAFTRYQKLKGLPTDVKMETSDSINFKLYFLLAANPADTARLLDSLRTNYTPKWSKAFIDR